VAVIRKRRRGKERITREDECLKVIENFILKLFLDLQTSFDPSSGCSNVRLVHSWRTPGSGGCISSWSSWVA
jgi:hypothetical protein